MPHSFTPATKIKILTLIFFGSIILTFILGSAFNTSSASPLQLTKTENFRQKTFFTVEDAVEMTKIIDPFLAKNSPHSSEFKFSPDRQNFIIVTQKGDLKSGYNIAEILLYNTQKVLEYLNSNEVSKLPTALLLSQFSNSSNNKTIHSLKWLPDNKTIMFIGEKPGLQGQVYRVDINTKEIKQLTDHPRSVESFAWNEVSQTIVYLSTLKTYNHNWKKTNYLVGTMSIHEVISRGQAYPGNLSSQWLRYYTIRNSQIFPLTEPFFKSSGINNWLPFNCWISPNGNYVVVLKPTHAKEEQKWISQYRPFKNSEIYSNKEYDENTMPPTTSWFRQFVIINLKTQDIVKVIDAPVGTNVGGINILALWLKDNSRVILANTFLPFNSNFGGNIPNHSPAIIQYDIDDDKISKIEEITVLKGESRASEIFTSMSVREDGLLETMWSKREGKKASIRFFEDRNGEWIKKDNLFQTKSVEENQTNLKLSIKEDLNTRPNIVAYDMMTGKEKIITDLNPQIRKKTFGMVKEFNWIDSGGRKWKGGLVYPPDFDPNKQYPLIIQTGGFFPKKSLVMGVFSDVTTGASAAQPLANSGMVVLQMQNVFQVVPNLKRVDEIKIHRDGMESAIKSFTKIGFIDVDKIGLIGFSRTGFYIQDMIVFSKYNFAAALVSDSSNLSTTALSSFFGLALGMFDIENLIDSVPWGPKLDTWVNKDPNLHLDFVKTPLRIEQNSSYFPLWWSTYTMLKRMRKPVEMLIFPRASHSLKKPREQLASQQGAVDWFNFWLLDKEDTSPDKADQYRRWRNFRKQQKHSEYSAILARKRSNLLTVVVKY